MQQLLLAETQHQIMLRNNKIRLPREIHNTISKIEEIEHEEPAKPPAVTTPKRGVGAPKHEPPRIITPRHMR